MEFNLSGKITFEDFIAFYIYYLKYIFFRGWRKFVFLFLAILFVCVMIYIGASFVIVLVSIFIVFLCIFYKKELKKQFYSNKFYAEEQHYLITIDRIEIKSENTSAILTKDKINKIWYNKKAIYIFISSNFAYVLPKTFFENNDSDLIKTFLKENYEENVTKL